MESKKPIKNESEIKMVNKGGVPFLAIEKDFIKRPIDGCKAPCEPESIFGSPIEACKKCKKHF